MCCPSYRGQTGAGKTHTIFGSKVVAPRDVPANQALLDVNAGTSRSAQLGITPRAVVELYRLKQMYDQKMDVKITCYMLELCKEDIKDLLHGYRVQMDIDVTHKQGGDQSADTKKLESKEGKIRIAKDVNGVVRVTNTSTVVVDSIEQFESLLQFGSRRRTTSATHRNAGSSRYGQMYEHVIMN